MFLVRLIFILWIINYADNYLSNEWPEFRNGLYARVEKAWDDVLALIGQPDISRPNTALFEIINHKLPDQKHYLELLEASLKATIEKSAQPSKNFPVYQAERLERF